MKLGIIGLPNVGKSTLFNAITNAGAEAANYPFCTIEPNVGVVPVPDYRLDELAKMHNPEKYTPAVVEFVDIAGLVRGASKGEGRGNKFLSHIREVDALVHVVRCFEREDIIHVDGKIDPVSDMETINLELTYADLETAQRQLDRAKKNAKGNKAFERDVALFERIIEHLDKGLPVRSMEIMDLSETEIATLNSANLLTKKPVLYAANMSEDDFSTENLLYKAVQNQAAVENAEIIPISARIEEEVLQLAAEERGDFLSSLGLEESGLDRLVKAGYRLLRLISFLTAGPKEVRAWTIREGMTAPQAAGKIHTDFERGFIRAEVVAFDDLIRLGNMTAAKENGLVRSEGKEYVVKDGDVILFRFNV